MMIPDSRVSPEHVGSDEDYIECHSINECDYQASSDGPHPLYTREAASQQRIEFTDMELIHMNLAIRNHMIDDKCDVCKSALKKIALLRGDP